MKKQFLVIVICLTYGITSAQTLSLDSCKSLTIINNKKIIEAKLEVHKSEEIKKQASTKYFPHVSGGFVAMKADDYLFSEHISEANLPVYDGNPANIATATQFAYFPGMDINLLDYANIGYVAAVQPIYMGGQIRNGNKLAEMGIDISKHRLTLSQEDALIVTEQRYWALISLMEKMNTIKSYKELLDNLHEDVLVSYEAGLIGKADLLKVELKQNELQSDKIKLQNGIDMVGMALCQNMGIEYNASIIFEKKELGISIDETFYLQIDSVIQDRQEIQILKKAIIAESLQKRMVRGEHMPQLALGVQGLYMDMMEEKSTHGLAFVTLNVPISGWWEGSHKMKEHQIRIDIAQNKLEETGELLVLQIEKAYKELVESHLQIDVAKKNLEQVEEHLKVTEDNYKAGIISTSDMLEAQAMYQQAEDSYTDSLCNSKIRLAYFRKATATLDN